MDISISSLSLDVPAGGKLSSTEGRPESLGPGSEQSTTGQATESPTPQTWQEPVDFIAMVALVLEHDVHQLKLEPSTGVYPQAWQRKNMYTSFNLGEGASSFLELHAMRQKVDLQSRSLRKGDHVALKRCFVDRFDDDVGVTPEQYDFIKRELRVFCHQRLRSHENIFLDIALGLEALHDVGIVHGDVKTGNILVFAHPQREVVAKLSDFSDSIYLADNGQAWTPVGGTHAWRAPECYGTAEYDLKKTDVYSFGLCALAILAQGIWYESANNTGLGDCFLVRIKELDEKTKNEVQAQVTSWKQDADNLVLRWGLEWADAFTNGDDIAKTNALFVVSACLWREPEKRKSMDTVIWGQFEVLSSAGEQQRMDEYIASRNTRDDESDNGIDRRQRSSDSRMASIENEKIRDMHVFFKSRMLRALEKIASPALDLDFADVDDVLGEPTELNYADILSAVAQGSEPITPAGMHEKTTLRALKAAAQVAECYSIGFGTPQDFSIARKWLTVSARSGRLDHAIYFSAIDDALGHSELDRPEIALRELWLLLTASGGCTETSRVLKGRHPDLYTIAKRIRRRSGGILRNARDPEAVVGRIADRPDNEDLPIDHKFPPIGYTMLHFAVAFGHGDGVKGILDEGASVNAVDYTGSTPLQLATSCGNGRMVDILLKHGADPCIGSDIFRFTPLHFLSFVEDEFLDSIAEAMVRSAEQLNVISSERGSVGLENPFQSLKGSPLQWAARKPNERLFIRLLNLHLTFSATLVDLDEVLENLAWMHQPSMLDVLIPLVPKLRSNGRPLDPSELDKLLLCCIKGNLGIGYIMVHRGHYEKAKMDTLEVLLKAGADPFRLSATQFNSPNNILQHIVIRDDLDVLNRLVSFGEDRQLDLRAMFEDTARFRGRNAFQRAIYCTSWRIFQYLTQSPYINLEYRSERGMTALHAAVIGNDPRFIDMLLRLGCDPYARSADGRTPFQSAIFFKAFKSASRLLQPDACTPERLFAATIEACNPAGYTLFGSVLAAALTNYRHTVNFTSIRFLECVGAFTFVDNILYGTTLLGMIAKQYPTIRPDYAAFDRALLEYILSRALPGVLNKHDDYGLTPLHWMVLRGNLSAIMTVLTHPSSQGQIDVNVETIEARPTPLGPQIAETGSNPGQTALNLALLRRRRIPDFIKQGGQREMRQWGLRTEAIIEVLQEAGGSVGSESSEAEELEAAGVHVVHPGDDILSSLLVPVLGQRYRAETSSHDGAWPLRLQHSRSSPIREVEDDDLEDGNNESAEPAVGGEIVTRGGMVQETASQAGLK
ncbi:hypothetical protein K469DRAFT_778594 [Zopfia rhizophila CBS 207.26]|uniref:Protein kinase domain-containing protein n=1 Tax=Zopfia rhizophila CBS 207.26 TaxID=1314779 RepID=A0A6A6E307_9PEZI|nr:hypothetical protein K469DRAFT_778594 [Zopfia rhizophila CBS 207.26]